MTAPLPRLTLILGGARSGKSRYGETLVMSAPPPWVYVATAEAGDAEMTARIAAHKARRPGSWTTLEAPLDLAGAISNARGDALLVDCLTLWLSNILLAGRSVEAEIGRLLAALREAPGPLVAVSNEVGLGIVPDTALGREFRDAQGRLNAEVAGLADHVVLLIAGLPQTLKHP